MEQNRSFVFSLEEAKSKEGVTEVIGRASDRDESRKPRVDNLLFRENSLSKRHAVLCLKLLEPLQEDVHIIDQFRICIKDLYSSYGIVDLNSEEADPNVIDLKNGERFGLIQLDQPISIFQRRAAKLKFQINIQYHDPTSNLFECIVKDVSFDDSPFSTRPPTFGELIRKDEDGMSSLSETPSGSEVQGEEEFNIVDIYSDPELNTAASIVDEDGIIEGSPIMMSTADSTKDNFTFVSYPTEHRASSIEDWAVWKPADNDKDDNSYEEIKSNLESNNITISDEDLSYDDPVLLRINKRSLVEEIEKGELDSMGSDCLVNKKIKKDANISIGKREIIISGMVGFAIGSLSTFGILLGIANNLEQNNR